ncbi:hypothetical protein GEMRC1_008879 [Eukaryota sp. GEM-RC1]
MSDESIYSSTILMPFNLETLKRGFFNKDSSIISTQFFLLLKDKSTIVNDEWTVESLDHSVILNDQNEDHVAEHLAQCVVTLTLFHELSNIKSLTAKEAKDYWDTLLSFMDTVHMFIHLLHYRIIWKIAYDAVSWYKTLSLTLAASSQPHNKTIYASISLKRFTQSLQSLIQLEDDFPARRSVVVISAYCHVLMEEYDQASTLLDPLTSSVFLISEDDPEIIILWYYTFSWTCILQGRHLEAAEIILQPIKKLIDLSTHFKYTEALQLGSLLNTAILLACLFESNDRYDSLLIHYCYSLTSSKSIVLRDENPIFKRYTRLLSGHALLYSKEKQSLYLKRIVDETVFHFLPCCVYDLFDTTTVDGGLIEVKRELMVARVVEECEEGLTMKRISRVSKLLAPVHVKEVSKYVQMSQSDVQKVISNVNMSEKRHMKRSPFSVSLDERGVIRIRDLGQFKSLRMMTSHEILQRYP